MTSGTEGGKKERSETMAAVKEVSRDLSQAGHSVMVYQIKTNGFLYYGVMYSPPSLPPVYKYVVTLDRAMDLRARFLCDGEPGA